MPVHRFLLRRRWLQLLDGSTVATAEAAQSSEPLAAAALGTSASLASAALAATAAATEPASTLATPVSTASSALAATTLAAAFAATLPSADIAGSYLRQRCSQHGRGL